MLKPGPLDVKCLDKPYVAVVQHHTQPPNVIHQVTLRPDKVRGEIIRIGETPGDEIFGWNYPKNLNVIEILGEAVEVDGKWECRPIT